MDFTFSAEQELLRDGLSKFLAGRYDLETSRAAAKSGPGWQPDIWQSFAEELGILGAALPEDAGGIGGGFGGVMCGGSGIVRGGGGIALGREADERPGAVGGHRPQRPAHAQALLPPSR